MKWFKREAIEDLSELSSDAMNVITDKRLLDSLRMKLQDSKMTKLEYYIANVNSQWLPLYKVRMPVCTEPHFAITMSLGSWRACSSLNSVTQARCLVGIMPSSLKYEDIQVII